ncbi:hypothetical protein HF086_014099 [Spodoptera exigua]|uniref:CBS domain-containing protein n=1 Tax=Spodoptera exigua TaxID=7107 RepID=A0A922ML23_SPOEX|nr:hypothetical protein HF086_014099 [Spodoptera exigua]
MVRNTSNLVSFRRRDEKPPQREDGVSSVLELVGNTPLVKLNRLPLEHGVKCEVCMYLPHSITVNYAKCEFMNPGGSIKDRIALAMMQDARKDGAVHDQTEFVEVTSGNTGIGIALNATLMGNKCIIVTQDKNSSEKVNTMRLLGAEVIQTKNGALETAIARQLKDDNPDTVVMLNQFDNEINPRAHYENTGEEIVADLGSVDVLVLGAGSGGTLSGVGSKLKEVNPDCKLVAAEPDGSVMINKDGNPHPFLVEGIGGSEAPIILDKSLVDHVEVVTDKESFLMARELSKKEGLLCGGSSGAAVCAAFKAAKSLNIGHGKRVVVILPDGIRNYMSKFVSDQWMEAHRFLEPPQHTMKWWTKPVSDLNLNREYPKMTSKSTCHQVLEAMNETNVNIAVIVDDNGHYVGAVSKDSLRNRATNPTKLPGQVSEEYDFQDVVTDHLDKHVYTLADNIPEDTTIAFCTPSKVVTGDDVLDYIFESSKTIN